MVAQMIAHNNVVKLRVVKEKPNDQSVVAQYTENLIDRWSQADPEWLARGINWYGEVRAEVLALADAAGVSLRVAAGVAAVFSQDNSWRKNLKGLGEALSAHKRGERVPQSCHRYGKTRERAQAILDGADPEWVMDNWGKGSDSYKCKRFFANITGDLSVVTIDRWHNRFCQGNTDTTIGVPSGKAYRECEEATINAARKFGLDPAKFQAGLWTDELREGAY